MNFDYSIEQKLIGEQARTFLQRECTNDVVRQVLDSDALYAKGLWKQMAELGWMAITIPEAYGGVGLSYLELTLIAEEIGRALAPVPYSSSVYLATDALLLAGSSAQKEKWLPTFASGSTIGTLAIQPERVINQRGSLPSFDQNVLQGKTFAVPDAELADVCVVLCKEGDGEELSLVLVDLAQTEISITPAEGIDGIRTVGDIDFSGATVERLGEKGQGLTLLNRILQRAAVLFAFEQLGGSDAALEQARDYAMDRFAFGRPIASFQAIKHKLAQGAVKNMMARSNCFYGAWALDADAPDLALAAATARVSAIQAYYYCSKENIQTHGGTGFTWEYDCHIHYRRAKYLSLVIGGESTWKKQLSGQLLKRRQD